MSNFWKVAGTFVGVLGAVAIIYQLNQGKLASTAGTTFTGVVGDMFASTGSPSNNSPGTTGTGMHTNPAGNPGAGNKTHHSTQYTNVA